VASGRPREERRSLASGSQLRRRKIVASAQRGRDDYHRRVSSTLHHTSHTSARHTEPGGSGLVTLVCLLPLLQWVVPVPSLPWLGLDEALAFAMASYAVLRAPVNIHRVTAGFTAVAAGVSVLNLAIFVRPEQIGLQVINVFGFFGAMGFAFYRTGYSVSAARTGVVRALWIIVGLGWLQQLSALALPTVYRSWIEFSVQSNTIGRGLIGPRFNSVLPEPSHFVQVAAFGFALLFFDRRSRSDTFLLALIVGGLVLTGSALAVSAVFLPFVVSVTFRAGPVAAFGALSAVVSAAVLEWQMRVLPELPRRKIEEFINGLFGTQNKLDANASSGSLLHGIDVMTNTITDTGGLGVGLGSYNYAFELYTPASQLEGVFFTSVSGGGLFIRLVTELGLVGALVIVVVFVKSWPTGAGSHRSATLDALLWASASVFVVSVIRQGAYTGGWIPLAVTCPLLLAGKLRARTTAPKVRPGAVNPRHRGV